MRRLITCVGVAGLLSSTPALADDPVTDDPTTRPSHRFLPAPPGTAAAADDLPLRFRDMLEFEAARARPQRLFNGMVWTVSSLGLIGAGAISLGTASSSDPNAGVVRSYGAIMLGIGGTTLLAALIGMIPASSVERLYKAYAPIAIDARFTTASRLRLGEDALRTLARKDATNRYIAGTVAIVAGVAVAIISVWRGTWTQLAPADRAISGTLTGASALLALGSGIGRIAFERGSAEVAMAHWQASQGRMRDVPRHASIVIVPRIEPIEGGVLGGLGGTF